MIEAIEHMGILIREASVPGEIRAEEVVPAHPNGMQVSWNRWLIIYATRSFRGVDDDLSILYQLRDQTPEGRLIAEGVLAKSIDDWDALGDGQTSVRQHGHPVIFGVPKGALIYGEPAPGANLFVVKWRLCARALDPNTGLLLHANKHSELRAKTQSVEWVQIRLNDDETDVEVVQSARRLRQKGYEEGSAFCRHTSVSAMNQAFVQAVRFNETGTEWADCNHFDGGRIAALKYVFNGERNVYEWTETGPLLSCEYALTEASLVCYGDDWLVSARTSQEVGGVAWSLSSDPFKTLSPPVFPGSLSSNSPITAYRCADGSLRLFGGDVAASPYGNGRNPLYCWDVDPDNGFICNNRREIFDSVKVGLPIHHRPTVDMCKLLPQAGGRSQYVVHRLRPKSTRDPDYTGHAVTDEEIGCAGIYYGRIDYDKPYPGMWTFGSESEL